MSSYPPALRFLPLLCRESSFFPHGFRGATGPLSHMHAYLSGLRGPAFHFPGLAIPSRSGNRPSCEPFGSVSGVPGKHRWHAEPALEVHQVHIRQTLPIFHQVSLCRLPGDRAEVARRGATPFSPAAVGTRPECLPCGWHRRGIRRARGLPAIGRECARLQQLSPGHARASVGASA